jgi:hypothetical protein
MANIIKAIRRNVEWPGQLNAWGSDPVWDSLRQEIHNLDVNGATLEVEFENREMIPKAQAVCSSYCTKLDGNKKGWQFQTRSQGNSLFIHKAALKGK